MHAISPLQPVRNFFREISTPRELLTKIYHVARRIFEHLRQLVQLICHIPSNIKAVWTHRVSRAPSCPPHPFTPPHRPAPYTEHPTPSSPLIPNIPRSSEQPIPSSAQEILSLPSLAENAPLEALIERLSTLQNGLAYATSQTETQQLLAARNALKTQIGQKTWSDQEKRRLPHISPTDFSDPNVLFPSLLLVAQKQLETCTVVDFCKTRNIPCELSSSHLTITPHNLSKFQEFLEKIPLPYSLSNRQLQIELAKLSPFYQLISNQNKKIISLHKLLDAVYVTPQGTPLGLRVEPCGDLHFSLRTHGEITTGPLYSLFLLIRLAEETFLKKLPQAEKPPALWASTYERILQDDARMDQQSGYLDLPFHLLEEMLDLLHRRDHAKDQCVELIQSLFSPETLQLTRGTKTFADFSQQGQNLSDEDFTNRFGMNRICAQMLESEPREIFHLPDAIGIETRSDLLMTFFEQVFASYGWKSLNGQNKTFINETRAPGALHRANINLAQLEALIPSLQALSHMLNMAAENNPLWAQRKEALQNPNTPASQWSMQELVTAYEVTRRAFWRTQGCEMELGSSTWTSLQQKEAQLFRDHIRQNFRVGPKTWERRLPPPTSQTLYAAFYQSANLTPLSTHPSNVERANHVQEKLQIVYRFFESSPAYHQLQQNPIFRSSYASFQRKFQTAISDAKEFPDPNSYWGVSMLENAFTYFERAIYYLTPQTADRTFQDLQEEDLSLRLRIFLNEYRIQNAGRWEGCTQGLAQRLQAAEGNMSGASLPQMKYKMELAERIHIEASRRYGYEGEAQGFYSQFMAGASSIISLPIEADLATRISPIGEEAGHLIQQTANAYDLFVRFYDVALTELALFKKEQGSNPTEWLQENFSLSEEQAQTYMNPTTLEWDFFQIEQELPFQVLEKLTKEGFLIQESTPVHLTNPYPDFWKQVMDRLPEQAQILSDAARRGFLEGDVRDFTRAESSQYAPFGYLFIASPPRQ